MKDIYKTLPYRDNVACIVFKDDEFLLVQLHKWEPNWWKFPQGGIDEGEKIEDAASRELREEIGDCKIKIVGTSTHRLQYDWDDVSIQRGKCRWRGQNQRYVLVEFKDSEENIQLQEEELHTCCWVKKDKLKDHLYQEIPPFVGYWDSIEKVLTEFSSIWE